MKKIISGILALTLLLSLSLTSFAASFTDFDDSHWAAAYVNALVSDGTINGFEDGSFRPAGTVTRAEFVKMIGKGPERAISDFTDVPSTHWAYEYIMTSGLDPVYDNTFMPSQPITRGEVATLLWKRAGAPLGVNTPPVIHRQGKNADAISWVYTNSIMTGDDNINLRLADTLTRAEAAALIVRSRNVSASTAKTDFINAVDSTVFETAYKAFRLVDKEYSENATLTNGELAMAAARIISQQDSPDYPGVSATKSFEHKYAQPLNMLCRYYLGTENDNAEYVDKNATVKDAIMAFSFATLRTSYTPITFDPDGSTYENVGDVSENGAKFLKAAYQNGISFTADMKMDMEKEITLKELACLMIEFDGFSGFYTFDRTGKNVIGKDYKINTNLASYPANASDYVVILDGINNSVYEKPFVNAIGTPAAAYSITNTFDGVFNTMFTGWLTRASSKGADITITSSPLLSVATSTGYTFRVMVKINSVGSAAKLSDIIKCANDTIGSKALKAGEEFWLDIDTGKPFNDITFPFENVFVSQLV